MVQGWEPLLTRWTRAGVLDEEMASRIRAFEQTHASSNRLRWPIRLALAFGALTLAAGVLLFVSAHWDSLSPATRFGLVTLLVAAFHVGGALSEVRFPSMSMALHAVGTVALGGGIFLAGQIFNLDEHWPGGLMLWALGATVAWALLKAWPQMALAAILVPAWLTSEWLVATDSIRASSAHQVVACGLFLLALTYFTAIRTESPDSRRQTLIRLGGLSLPFTALTLVFASVEPYVISVQAPPAWLQIVGWTFALGLPLMLAAFLRGLASWRNVLAELWVLALVRMYPAAGELALYAWWALGAIGLAAWGVDEARSERINMGAAIFGATLVAFYFSQVMDKLGRSASLIGLGLVFLAGGWAIERVRRRLVLQTRGVEA